MPNFTVHLPRQRLYNSKNEQFIIKYAQNIKTHFFLFINILSMKFFSTQLKLAYVLIGNMMTKATMARGDTSTLSTLTFRATSRGFHSESTGLQIQTALNSPNDHAFLSQYRHHE